MADDSLKEIYSFINPNLELSEALQEQISKAKALVNVALLGQFLECSTTTLHDYIWVLGDVLDKVGSISERLSKGYRYYSN